MIRPYRDTDIDDVIEIWLAASRLAHPFLSEEFLESEKDTIREVHMAQAESWVWEEDGRVWGFISLLGNEIGGLFVSPDFQRGGIGTALVDFVRPLHETLEVEVFKNNRIGCSFYRRYGFEQIGERFDERAQQTALRLRCGRTRRTGGGLRALAASLGTAFASPPARR